MFVYYAVFVVLCVREFVSVFVVVVIVAFACLTFLRVNGVVGV